MELPGAAVPHDHVAAAVLAARDHALEVGVVERVVLDVDREVPRRGIEGQALRHRPAHEHAVDLEPEVVVQTAGAMPLHHEAGPSVAVGAPSPAGSGVRSKSRFCR